MELETTTEIPRRWGVAAGWGLLSLFVLLAGFSLSRDSVTFDETAHLAAGYTYLDRGDFRLNPEHPPLFKIWAAAPLWLGGLAEPDYAMPAWIGEPVDPPGTFSNASQWTFGYRFLNGTRRSLRDPMRLLVPARLAMLVPGILLGLLVWRWAGELWGRRGGLLSLFFYATSPTMLAHTRLVTSDLAAALGFAATLYGFWRFRSRPGWLTLLAGSLALAAALLVKFSTLLLLPCLALLALEWIASSPDRAVRRTRVTWCAAACVTLAVVVVVSIWGAYGFRYAAAADPSYRLSWEVIGLRGGGPVATMLRLARELRVVPEAFVYGLDYALGGATRRAAFLNGELSDAGWWYYFPEAFFLKTPIPTLLVTLAVGLTALRRPRVLLRPALAFLWLPAAIYLLVLTQGNLNIGHRHLAPLYPLLFVALGAASRWLHGNRLRSTIRVGLLSASTVALGLATPCYLSYFNLLVGGSSRGWHYLLDSNVDWGQGLIRLRDWMQREGVDSVHLAYFGTGDPAAYGIRYRKVVMVHEYYPRIRTHKPGPGDLFAVSVNLLQGLYFDDEAQAAIALVRQGWTDAESLRRWRRLREESRREGREYPDLMAWLVSEGLLTESRRRVIHAGLMSTWIRELRERTAPIARPDDSILVFRIPEHPATISD